MKTKRIIKNGKMVGYFIAFINEDTNKVHIGHSLCAKCDKFDKSKARIMAFDRADLSWDRVPKIPQSILLDYLSFYRKCTQYFKGGKFFEEIQVYDSEVCEYNYEDIERLIEFYAINN